MSNQTTIVQNNFSRSDTIILSVIGAAVIATLIFFISKLITISLISVFGYDNFDIFNMSNGQMYLWISCISLFLLIIMGFVAKIYKKLIFYFTFMFVILTGAFSIIHFNSSGLSLEQFAYQKSLETFENTFLKSRFMTLNVNHPDLVTFYHYKNNPTISKPERQEYFKTLESNDDILKKLSRFTTVYNMGNFATYFVSQRTMDNFFMTYADVENPQLKLMRDNMLKQPLVKTTDYIAFHTLYRQQFISKNLLLSNTSSILPDRKSNQMVSASEVSSIIHFFENNNASELNEIKGSFVTLLSQPVVTEVQIEQFRTQLTQTLKANPKLYALMSQL